MADGKKIKLRWDLLSLLVLLAGLTAFGVWRSGLDAREDYDKKFFSPADQTRAAYASWYKSILAERTPRPVAAIVPADLKLSWEGNSLSMVGLTSSPMADEPPPAMLGKKLGAWKCELGTSTVELVGFARLKITNPRKNAKVPYTLFSPEGMTISTAAAPAEMPALLQSDEVRIEPKLQVVLRIPDSDWQVLGFVIADAQTHVPGGYGYERDHRKDLRIVNFYQMDMVAPRPVKLVARLGKFSPPQRIEFTTGSLLKTSQTQVRVAAALQCPQTNDIGWGPRIQLRFKPETTQTMSLALVQSEPANLRTAMRYRLLDRTGKAQPTVCNVSLGERFMVCGENRVTSTGEALRATQLEVRYPMQTALVVFDLPTLPGAPGAPVQNLFAQRVPYLAAGSPYELQDMLGRLVQMNYSAAPVSGPWKAVEYRDKTVLEMFKDIEAQTGVELEIDNKLMMIRPGHQGRSGLRAVLGKIGVI